jgi:tetratricopeptide (TPR) repeat protein
MAKQIIPKVSKEEVLVDVAEVTKDAQHWLEKYQKPILYGAIALVVAVGGWYAWKYKVDGDQKKAVQAIYKAEQMFEKDSFATALNTFGGGFDGFLDISRKYGSTPAGNIAHYYAGICYLNLGKFDEAIKQLEDFSPSGDVTPTMKFGALADAYSEKQDFGKALKLYKEAASAGGIEDMKAMYLKRYGMLSEKQNDVSSALDAYKEIKEKYTQSADARDIDKYIARAESKKK